MTVIRGRRRDSNNAARYNRPTTTISHLAIGLVNA